MGERLNKEEIISFLQRHKKILEDDFGVTKIALFGSYARGQQHVDSDIDLLIEMKERDFRRRFFLKEFLEDHFQKKVDVGYFDAVRSFIMQSVEKELIYA